MVLSNAYNYINVLDKAADASWTRNDVLANNIANADTPGYKRKDVQFEAAMGFALESNIPYGVGFIKNSYVGRTFIKPKQSARESSVNIKLNALKEVVSGKRVVMVDDSSARYDERPHCKNAQRCRSD